MFIEMYTADLIFRRLVVCDWQKKGLPTKKMAKLVIVKDKDSS